MQAKTVIEKPIIVILLGVNPILSPNFPNGSKIFFNFGLALVPTKFVTQNCIFYKNFQKIIKMFLKLKKEKENHPVIFRILSIIQFLSNNKRKGPNLGPYFLPIRAK